ncbi:MAG TPA: hypothetical protein V6C58_28515, partial [Allocoleopsis sp.]
TVLQNETINGIVSQNNTFSTVWFRFFENVYKSIRGNTDIKLGGLLNINTTSASNSGSSQTDLISYTLPKNYLKNNGDALEVEAWGIYAANGNNKTVTLNFGSQTILTTGAVAANSGSFIIKATIIRTAAATQEIISEIISSNSSVSDSTTRTAGTQTLSDDLIIKCTATGSSSNDVTQYALKIKLFPNS